MKFWCLSYCVQKKHTFIARLHEKNFAPGKLFPDKRAGNGQHRKHLFGQRSRCQTKKNYERRAEITTSHLIGANTMAEERKVPHNLILEDKSKLSISGVSDVDTFDEAKIILFTEEDTIEIEGYDLHIQKLNVDDGELIIEGEIVSILYSGRDGYKSKGKGFFKKMLK